MSQKDNIQKRVAELASWYSSPFCDPVYSKYRPIEKTCLFLSRWYYRLTSGFFYDIKYFLQRIFRGYDDLDKWNAAWYIARKSIPVLKDMRNNIHGTSIKWHREDRFGNIVELSKEEVYVDDGAPPAFTEEEWEGILDDIIFAFQFVLDQDLAAFNQEEYNKNYARHKRGLKLFGIYILNLWD